jgi:hypothetical protein
MHVHSGRTGGGFFRRQGHHDLPSRSASARTRRRYWSIRAFVEANKMTTNENPSMAKAIPSRLNKHRPLLVNSDLRPADKVTSF